MTPAEPGSPGPRLLAVSDLHVSFAANREIVAALRPGSPGDWLLVAGDVLRLVADDAERAWVTELLAAAPAVSWDRLLFSAKESVYKAWYPLTGRWLDFSEASLTVDAAARTFAARLLVPATRPDGRPLTGFTGRWLARDGLVLTVIVLPRAGGADDAG